MFAGIKKAFTWLFGNGALSWRTAVFAFVLGGLWWIRDQVEAMFAWLLDLFPDNVVSMFADWVPFLQIANYWIPLQEFFAIYAAYSTWRYGFIALRLIVRLLRG